MTVTIYFSVLMYSERPNSVLRKARQVVGIIGAGPALGEWGKRGHAPLLLRPKVAKELNANGKECIRWEGECTIDFRRLLEYRVVVVDPEIDEIVAVDAKTTKPPAKELFSIEGIPLGGYHMKENGTMDHHHHVFHPMAANDGSAGANTRMEVDIDATTECVFWGTSELPSLHCIRFTTLLRLNIFPAAADRAFNGKEQKPVIQVTKVSTAKVPSVDWAPLMGSRLVTKNRSGDVDPTELASSSHTHRDRSAFPRKLQRHAPVQWTDAEGEKSNVTMPFWSVTADLAMMQNEAIIISFVVDDKKDGSSSSKPGTAVLLPRSLQDENCGHLVLPALLLTGECIGELDIWFVLVSSVPQKQPLRFIRSTETFKELQCKNYVGHRGLGSTYHQAAKRHKLTENSVESMMVAYNRGCEYVELDVMLTGDNVPVVYHDPVAQVAANTKSQGQRNHLSLKKHSSSASMHMEDFDEEVGSSMPKEMLSVGIHQLSRRQLDTVFVHPFEAYRKPPKLKQLVVHHWIRIMQLAGRKVSTLKAKRFTRNYVQSRIPSLVDLLHELPDDLGFLIEVKFPTQPLKDSMLHKQSHHFDVNKFVDVILTAVLAHGSDRQKIAFCCFEPSVTIALALKQSRYPVLFLVDSTDDDLRDYRCFSNEAAVQLAIAERLAGVSIVSSALLRGQRWPPTDPADEAQALATGNEFVKFAASQRLFVYTWGPENEDHCWGDIQRFELGVAGVITDNVVNLPAPASSSDLAVPLHVHDHHDSDSDDHLAASLEGSTSREGETTNAHRLVILNMDHDVYDS